ncbi:hypothetical protein P154DRAFT_421868 [Amniculicola lignicola CBS 123094]|uniref:Transmembrane protein n=1 Tax=Amniculicola lignicola CBS 123094 TaxID=1392246 RepID=A0A6A5X2V4_9PLEO|nr:hypothetical protein P154DRAFT_421868 [Amniculicola lignicola CBS 123094]
MKYNPVRIIRGTLDHELSYNLTRPYPRNRWYSSKLLVSVLFLALSVFFVLFNLANSGYDLQLRYTTNPNDTETQRHWFNRFTFGDDKLKARCQHLHLPVGYQFITTNLGLRYTVATITQNVAGEDLHTSMVSYLNNTLRDCEVDSINVHLEKADRSPPGGFYWSWQKSSPSISASCFVENEEGVFKISFVSKNLRLNNYDYVAVTNHTSHASIWWGTRILNNYWFGIRVVMAGELPDDNYHKKSQEITLANIDFDPGLTDNMTSRELFDIHWSWAFFFAKVLRSLVLVDLGNDHPPNLLLDEGLLQYALKPHNDFNRQGTAPIGPDLKDPNGHAPWGKVRGIPPPTSNITLKSSINMVKMEDAYARFRNMTGPLATKNASIYAQYVCSVPEAKGVATAFLFTLVATLALLQTAWVIFKWLMEVAMANDPMAMYCEGCFSREQKFPSSGSDGEHELSPMGSRDRGDHSPSTTTLLRQDNRLVDSSEDRGSWRRMSRRPGTI